MNKWKIIFVLLVVSATAYLAIKSMVDGARMVDRNDGYQPSQPIAFSHKVHAGDNEVPCLYCHYGAERSRHAGIPAASVCMNCHSLIKRDSPEIKKIIQAIETKASVEWVKVHRLADFVYFNHQQHVVAGKIPCQTCHGAVEKMGRVSQVSPLTMGWCIDCHRKSDVVIHGTLQTKKVSEVGGLDCAKCHY